MQVKNDPPRPEERLDTYFIHSYESDFRGVAHIPALMGFMQDSAWLHAEELEFGYTHLIKENQLWAMSRMHIELLKDCKWGETVKLLTRPSGKRAFLYYRDYIFVTNDAQDISDPICRARSEWIVLNTETRKPERKGVKLEYEPVFAAPIEGCDFEKLRTPSSSTVQNMHLNHKVKYLDLDVNGHTNNASYVKWCMEQYSLDFIKTHTPKTIDFNFLAEAYFADDLEIEVYALESDNPGELIFLHDMKRVNDQTDICKVKIKWTKH